MNEIPYAEMMERIRAHMKAAPKDDSDLVVVIQWLRGLRALVGSATRRAEGELVNRAVSKNGS